MKKRYSLSYVLSVITVILILSGCGGKSETTSQQEASVEKEQTDSQPEKAAAEKKEIADPIYIAEGIRKISVTNAGTETLQISYEPREYESSYEYWKIRVPYGEHAVIDTEAMLKLYHQLESLTFVAAEDLPADTDTGLAESQNSIMAEFCQTDAAEREAMTAGQESQDENSASYQAEADSRMTLMIGNSNGADSYYTALKANPDQVYLMPKQIIDQIMGVDPFTLILKISASAGIDTVAEITVESEDQTYRIKTEEDGIYLDKKNIPQDEYHKLYGELFGVLVADKITDRQKLTQESLFRLEVKRNVAGAEDLKIVYHAYDDTYASVQVNGVEMFLVRMTELQQLQKTVKSIR